MTQETGKETKPETLTPEATLKSELEKARTELEGLKKGYSTVQQTLTEKDKELKRRTDLETQIHDLGDRVELLATAMATVGFEEGEELPKEKRQNVLAQLTQQRTAQEAKRKQDEYFRQADTIHNRAETVFAGDDEKLERIEDLLMSGIPTRMERAEGMVAKAEKALVEKPKEPPKDIEKIVAERLEEEKRKLMEEQGRLVSETGTPAGSTGGTTYSLSQVDNMSSEEYRKVFPTESSFKEALREGRITQ